MCKALKDLIEEGKREGREEGEAKTLVKNVESVMDKFGVDLETACNGVGITVSEYDNAKSLARQRKTP